MLQLSGVSLAITLIVAIVGLLGHAFWIGWWASRIGAKIEGLTERLQDVKQSLDGRYLALELKVAEDHEHIRQIQTWKAGMLLETLEHVYPKSMVDQMFSELRNELKTMRAILDRRQRPRDPEAQET